MSVARQASPFRLDVIYSSLGHLQHAVPSRGPHKVTTSFRVSLFRPCLPAFLPLPVFGSGSLTPSHSVRYTSARPPAATDSSTGPGGADWTAPRPCRSAQSVLRLCGSAPCRSPCTPVHSAARAPPGPAAAAIPPVAGSRSVAAGAGPSRAEQCRAAPPNSTGRRDGKISNKVLNDDERFMQFCNANGGSLIFVDRDFSRTSRLNDSQEKQCLMTAFVAKIGNEFVIVLEVLVDFFFTYRPQETTGGSVPLPV